MRHLLASALVFVGAGGAVAQFEPRIVTEQTLVDSEALARLQRPGDVFFADDAESESGFDRFLEVGGRGTRATLSTTMSHSGDGSYELLAPARDGGASGTNATIYFGPAGYDVVYFRRYIRFAEDYDQGNLNHVGGGLAAVAGSDPWAGMGQAGKKPTGDDRFNASFEPWKDWGRHPAPGYLFFYAYWMDMTQDRDGNYWENFIQPPAEERLIPERGQWICLEQMLRANDPGEANGELAGWVDGKLYLHATGIRWRSSDTVRIKRANVLVYIHQARQDNRVWYDDIALSTGYIGPLPGAAGTIVEPASWGQLKSAR
ncbi:MAG: hypothetical protein HOM68_22090 [Gemmatimonadetes bacterium]|nr:hypothetical protein [Gemmatimonadota bacterium]MBT5145499.1 hypothetical protein [Gemmatimonadota bacterium]MBT5591687.1 hypothetical protein [Gemmatimonadota bacterium]MBT5961858.1 hypothetical protein [Gemmatimonadota bacterium]MBT7452795.1 hypothetical protein [Gemmatimonadota bacterium]